MKPRRYRRAGARLPLIVYAAAALFLFVVLAELRPQQPPTASDVITCSEPRIVDGDTFYCGNARIRLAGIDAPEMPGHCATGRKCTAGDPHAARDYLSSITRSEIRCVQQDSDKYGRTVARCTNANGQDLSCAMVESGQAVRRYNRISCFLR